jgi:DNA-binding transcriptional MerR regulator
MPLDSGMGSRVQIVVMARRDEAPLRIGELARATALSPDSVRHYDRLGLLPSLGRTAGGYRLFPRTALRRVRVIQAALAIGFSLQELADVFRDRAQGRVPCVRVLTLAEAKLEALEAELVRLAELRDVMRGVIENWRTARRRSAPTELSKLLDSLADTQLGAARQDPTQRARRRARTRKLTKGT